MERFGIVGLVSPVLTLRVTTIRETKAILLELFDNGAAFRLGLRGGSGFKARLLSAGRSSHVRLASIDKSASFDKKGINAKPFLYAK